MTKAEVDAIVRQALEAAEDYGSSKEVPAGLAADEAKERLQKLVDGLWGDRSEHGKAAELCPICDQIHGGILDGVHYDTP